MNLAPARNNQHAGDCFESSIMLIQDLIKTPFMGAGGFFPIQMDMVVFCFCVQVFSVPSNGLRKKIFWPL